MRVGVMVHRNVQYKTKANAPSLFLRALGNVAFCNVALVIA